MRPAAQPGARRRGGTSAASPQHGGAITRTRAASPGPRSCPGRRI